MGQSDVDGVISRPIERKKEKLFIDLKFTCYNVKKKQIKVITIKKNIKQPRNGSDLRCVAS